jgi:23S rRNA (adenine2030-N6)-methyltransferase
MRGIGRLLAAPLGDAPRALLAPYLDVVAAANADGRLAVYPGSPLIARALLRPHDRLIACELEPSAAAALAANLRGDRRAKAIAIDGWTALSAYVPPKERRGLVLVDPPFEDAGDFARLAEGLAAAHRKWPTGIYLMWYPIKERGAPDALARRLRRLAIGKLLRAELAVGTSAAPAAAAAPARLTGCGLLIVNPPWRLAAELETLLPALAAVLSDAGAHHLDWLRREK